ncbi:type I polyketide synthase [Streptomyces yaizuensis]|uniref:SDR family NAD(P)-dependent oxidoreductase n=1 Tax=Streptomyces yaizuensis TaxID=2989713 RepID=A0ABQ5NSB8_9ACTN|nr:SDR family NAD(P)-dependent oxidoreductase [Streptomyces sp. YSPA8]GLF93266.1 SDR family NAD(P)-dependent oxidoreductase [Streptomyces sp. YSPA8]
MKDTPTRAVPDDGRENATGAPGAPEPIAVVGLSCRLAGAPDPRALWRLLREGRSALAAPPEGHPGAPRDARPGGYLDRVDTFDAAFFGISPREARAMDPQQRLMLELAWEALENAGIDPTALRESRTAVVAGAMGDDWGTRLARRGAGGTDRFALTGRSRGLIANRVSWTLGLRGPSLTVDTGQSSSLTAVHLACENLRSGEADLALAGGVNLLLAPEGTDDIAAFGALSPDGRCHTFDTRANGYARGEGGAVVVLKPLSRALADGDTVRCLVLGSAVNNDGGGDSLTTPRAETQREVVERALTRAHVRPADIDYVELHGTGTPVGDPVEAGALGAALGRSRPQDRPLLVGSVKTNVGHLEGAAGITGLLKVVLCLQHGELPPTLNHLTPHPALRLDEANLRVPTALVPWPRGSRPRIAGVSSFGMGGTNSHVVLAEAPRDRPGGPGDDPDGRAEAVRSAAGGSLDGGLVDGGSLEAGSPDGGSVDGGSPDGRETDGRETDGRPLGFVLSAHGPDALRAQAGRLGTHLRAHPGLALAPVATSLVTTRARLSTRAVVMASERTELLDHLERFASSTTDPGHTVTGEAGESGEGRRVALLFTGQGAQRPGAGRELAAVAPVFASALDEVCAHFAPLLDRPLREVLWPAGDGKEDGRAIHRTEYTQPALFALEVAQYRQLWEWGLRPDVLLGHSIGELAAAHVAGVLSLPDAAALVAARGRLMQALPGGGAMAALDGTEDEILAELSGHEHTVSIAAVNGPASVVVSGDAEAVDALVARWRERGRRTARLRVSHAFHSHRMDPMADEFARFARTLTYHPPTVPIVSDVTGHLAGPEEMASADYWVRQLRGTVRFLDGVRLLDATGVTEYVEVGPDTVLSAAAREAVPSPRGRSFTSLLRAGRPEARTALTAVATLYTRGVDLDPRALTGPYGQRVDLPTYPFQRVRHWPDETSSPAPEQARPAPGEDPDPAAAMESPAEANADPRTPLAAMTADDRAHAVLETVREHTAAVLGHPSTASVRQHESFRGQGLDSLGAVELCDRLGTALGLSLPKALVFDHPTPLAMAGHLASLVSGGRERAPAPVSGAGGSEDPVVVVGMACRFPGGVRSPEDLWRLLAEGGDAIGDFPDDRGWDVGRIHDPELSRPGTSYVRHGGFLDDAMDFDAAFFGISPREALAMDPQQRLLLETAWECLERAGIPADRLRGSSTGVFVGATHQEYGPAFTAADESGGYLFTGTTPSVAAGRIAYTLGLHGPALTVDTACSASLVALHLASRALLAGECDTAFAGGVTVMATPGIFSELSRLGGLSADGRCRAFGAGADGTGWSEGVGLVLLERLSVARAKGHRVWAVVRGSAINSDGASNGLTAPNGEAQRRVIEAALADAGVSAADVDAVEAHGTGTRLGDPIEAGALLATYGRGREGSPLWLGSVKSNIGHTQAAAGVAGVIKMIGAFAGETLPRTLYAEEPSEVVDWSAGGVELLSRERPWPRGERPRRAGVSSFGISGTNAHLILEEPEPDPYTGPGEHTETAPDDPTKSTAAPDTTEAPEPPGPLPFPLSARTPAALRGQATALLAHLDRRETRPLDLAHALATTRTVFEHRATVVAAGPAELRAGLGAVADGTPHPLTVASAAESDGRTVLVFPGHGSQWPGMARQLLRESPGFAGRLRECAAAVDALTDWSLLDALHGGPDAPSTERLDVAQPLLFAVMVALAHVWTTTGGVRPDAVVGHSQGEIAAACVAGVLTLEEAARVVVVRSRLFTRVPLPGAMASVALSADATRERLTALGSPLEISGSNSPTATTVAGAADDVHRFVAACGTDGIRARVVVTGVASHCALMDPLRAPLLEELGPLHPREGTIPLCSAVTGEIIDGRSMDAAYWFGNVRRPVDFLGATRTLLRTGHRAFLEMSPHPLLTTSVLATAEAEDIPVAAVGTLRRDDGGMRRLLLSFAEAHVRGVRTDPAALFPGRRPATVDLPTYAFERRRHWLGAGAADVTTTGADAVDHPLLGAAVTLPDGGALLTGRLAPNGLPWLSDHAGPRGPLLPGTAFAELALRAGDAVGCAHLRELVLEEPLLFAATDAVALQVSVGPPGDDGTRELTVHARPGTPAGNEHPWTRHASGTLAPDAAPEPAHDPLPLPKDAVPVPLDGFYARWAGRGHRYGPAFRGLRAAWRHGDEYRAEIALDDERRTEAGRFVLHPALLDAALHAVLLARDDAGATGDGMLLPFVWSGVSVFATGASTARVQVVPRDESTVTLRLTDASGAPLAVVESLTWRPMTASALAGTTPVVREALFRVAWRAPRADSRYEEPGHGTTPLPEVLDAAALGSGEAVLERLRARLADAHQGAGKLVVVTRGAVAARPGDTVPGLGHAEVWGLVRTAQTEYPDRFALLDLDCGDGADEPSVASAVRAALATGEDQLALRDGRMYAPRLTRAHAVEPYQLSGNGTVLVTGGTGTVGGLLARRLVTGHGARHLLLVSRRGPDAPGAGALRDRLHALGARVTIRACDITDRAALRRLLAHVPPKYPLTGIVHTAAVLDDGVLTSLTPERLTRVMRPKAEAALALHEETSGTPLEIFVLLSSVIGLLGGAGQANYAAANTLLDALAQHRAARGLPALSLAWGLWEQRSDLTELDVADLARLRRSGLLPMTTEDALDLFSASLGSDEPLLVPARLDLAGARRSPGASALLRTTGRTVARRAAGTDAGDGSGFAERTAALPAPERSRTLLELVRAHTAAVLGHADGDAVTGERAFREIGFDSLMAVELRNRVAAATGLRLPTTLMFDHPTPLAMAGHLASLVSGGRERAPVPVSGAGGAEDPVVVVGMACRFPGGVRSPEDLWRLLAEGGDAIGDFPDDRGWDLDTLFGTADRPGTSDTRHGGFLHDAGDFDAELFGIGPNEALAMDPQQRLLLETAWECLERAGIPADRLRGSSTGVFTGIVNHDYGRGATAVPDAVADHRLAGDAHSVASGRIAYTLGLHGPALSVDTACSSALVAIHLACRALLAGECDTAFAGGVTVMATPSVFEDFTRQRGLSADGRCRAFGAGADGTGWSEGVGLVLLERLSVARARGHRVWAVVRGSAINSDGASNGLTAPNGEAQRRVIEAALADAGVSAFEVDAVEAHGTGTRLGDPIEAGALLATYGRGREGSPLWLGSVKSNIGHTQAAAGVAGVIKMIGAFAGETLPRTLYAEEPSEVVDWSTGGVELLSRERAWPRGERPRRAGVSSFGISGTNAHLILEEPPADHPAEQPRPLPKAVPPALPLVLSARSPRALAAQARHLLAATGDADGPRLLDIAYALATTRTPLDHRRTVTGEDADGIRAALASVAEGRTGHRTARAGRGLALLFSGQGAQRPGAGAALHAAHPVFAAAFDEISALFEPHLGQPLHEVAFTAPDGPHAHLLDRTDHTQPVLFALETALWRLLESWGVRPHAVAGHSIGELAAAHAAGVLDLRSAVTLVAARGRLMNELPAGGAMVALHASEEEVLPLLAAHPGRIALAAVNGPRRVVVSGAEDAVRKVAAAFPRHRTLRTSHAFHSPLMDGALAEFGRVAATLPYQSPRLPLVSTLTGRAVEPEELCEPSYWVRHARETVRFADAVRTLAAQGIDTFAEIGPDTVLGAAVTEMFAEGDRAARPQARSALHRSRPDATHLAELVGWLHDRGAEVDWDAYFAGTGADRTSLPLYPFQRSRYWLGAATPHSPAPAPESEQRTDPGTEEFLTGLAGRTGAERRAHVLDTVRALVADRLGHTTPSGIAPDRRFLDMGLDSVGAVTLRDRLGVVTGLPLPVTLVYDRPTPGEVADLVLDALDAPREEPHRTTASDGPDTATPSGPFTDVLAELDRMETTLLAVADDDHGLREDIGKRLRRLASDWSGPSASPDLDAVSRDELLTFIDRELGHADN